MHPNNIVVTLINYSSLPSLLDDIERLPNAVIRANFAKLFVHKRRGDPRSVDVHCFADAPRLIAPMVEPRHRLNL